MRLQNLPMALLFCGLLAPGLGCSSAYVPQRSPRVAVVMSGGIPSYVRDGKTYAGGLAGGDLEEAVRGNPEAEEHARDYRASTITGLVTTLVGTVAVGTGAGLLAADNAAREPEKGRQVAGAATLGVGLVGYIAGLVLIASAQPHLWDAINIYNDGLAPRPPAPPAPPAR
jgi:hypothetical protein